MVDIVFYLKSYLLSRRRFLYLLLVFLLTIALFSYLFSDSFSLLLYMDGLLLFFSFLFIGWDLSVYFQTYRKALLYDELSPESPLESVLCSKIENLEQEMKFRTAEEQARQSDLMDYYTLWVHQIKTPIAATQLLLQDVEGETKKQLEQEVFKIDSYTNVVLQYLRLESFHDDLVLKREQLDQMVKEVVRKYAIFFIQKGLSLDLHDLEQEVITDKKWLLVLIEQVLSNSLKYTKEGKIEIYFDEHALYLKDTGIGIKNSDVLRVFERGFSGYNGRLTQQSSGLGLYLSKKIADQLGHDISIQSEVGQGTTVRIGFREKRLSID